MDEKEIRWKQRFQNFEKAYLFLEEGLQQKDISKFEEAGIIKSFEFTFELAWKTLKDFLESNKVPAEFPREVIKESFKTQLIDNGELWMEMLDKRNLMAHTYNETNAKAAMELIRNHYFEGIRQVYLTLKSVMTEFGLSEQSLQVIIKEIASHPQVNMAAIFGSRALGNYKKGSDVDIALFGEDVSFTLVSDIQAALNERTLQPYHFDLLSYSGIVNDDLKKHIDNFGKVIYKK